MTDKLNSFFELYGLRTRFEPEEWQEISHLDSLDDVLKTIETKLGLSTDPEESEPAGLPAEPEQGVKDAD